MFSSESRSSRQKRPTQGGGQTHSIPSHRHERPAGDGDGAQVAGASPQAKPSEPGQALAGFPVATLGSAGAGSSVQVAKEDTGEYWDWVGRTFLPLGRQR